MIKIDLLKNHPQTIPRLIEIWQEGIGNQWLPDYCVSRVGDKLHEHLNENSLPLTFVALADDEPAGMCSLRENDGIKPDFIYKQLSEDALSKMGWLGTLVVTSAYQKQGIAQTLIDAVKNKAQELGLEKLYLFAFDPTIPEYYTRLGWRTIGMDEFAGKPVTVMEIRVVAV